ncbi:hypothetical protein Cs7R123_39270 [Catellatospora sp. TT07R-123]|uniref:DUF3592 domain-containing protein n=1 Tax=Catellatospora sp. TT07R-123 TaxID=2733863 RepID=UPI001AFFD915|nr:DUF3592 domain-containing protein [Catellatospora sp. TT07R-123]GHJ46585.1 hypothetical protein Cs7R123_39270 [Catellatospora sp. TT07R-123]
MAEATPYPRAWTRRATGIGLAAALVFGLAALVTYLCGRADVERLVTHGAPADAAVVAVRHHNRIDTTVVRYDYGGRTYTAELTGAFGTGLAVGDHPTVYLDPAHPGTVATADGLASRAGHWLPPVLATIAGITAFLAIGGRIVTVRRRRWNEARLDDMPEPEVQGRRSRGVVRRRDGFASVMVAVIAVAVPIAAVVDPPETVAVVAGLLIPVAIAFYLLGLAVKIVITPRRLSLHTAFRVYHVPRHLIGGVDLADDDHVRVRVAGYRHLAVPMGVSAVWDVPIDRLNRRPAQLRAAAKILGLLAAVPAERTLGDVRTRPRFFTIVLGLLAGGTFAVVVASVLGAGRV